MKIALNTYSLRNEWELMKSVAGYGPVLNLLKKMNITEVELLDRTFHSDVKMLEEIQSEFRDSGITIFSLGPHVNPLTDEPNRGSRLADLKQWTDMAADHGIAKFRVSLGGGKYTKPKLKPKKVDMAVEWASAVLEPAVSYAESRDVTLCIETHHQFSSNPEFQEKLLNRIPSKNLGFAFDIGNYENDKIRWASLDVLLKKNAIKYMHAKAYKFDKNGFETTLDYPRAVKLMHDAGIDVNLSIEWEGKRCGPIGTLATNELCKYSIAKILGNEYNMDTSFWSMDDDEFMDAWLDEE